MCTLEKRGSIFILTLTGTNDEHRLNPPLLDSIKSALARVRSSSSSSTALITTAHGNFFSNGYDLAWAKTANANNRFKLMSAKLRSVITDLISLPMPTMAAGCILALSHDYVLMRKHRGFLYMSELDIGLAPYPGLVSGGDRKQDRIAGCEEGGLVEGEKVDGGEGGGDGGGCGS